VECLTVINLSLNNLDGPIADLLPWGSRCLRRLRSLCLAGNFLQGALPRKTFLITHQQQQQQQQQQEGGQEENKEEDICYGMPFLEELRLNDNRLSGNLPDSMVVSSSSSSSSSFSSSSPVGSGVTLPRLKVLDLSCNLFRGSLQTLLLKSDNSGGGGSGGGRGGFGALEELSLANNGFNDGAWKAVATAAATLTSSSSSSSVAVVHRLRRLDLSGNDFHEATAQDIRRVLKSVLAPGAALLVGKYHRSS
jgi:hypothetical protein